MSLALFGHYEPPYLVCVSMAMPTNVLRFRLVHPARSKVWTARSREICIGSPISMKSSNDKALISLPLYTAGTVCVTTHKIQGSLHKKLNWGCTFSNCVSTLVCTVILGSGFIYPSVHYLSPLILFRVVEAWSQSQLNLGEKSSKNFTSSVKCW